MSETKKCLACAEEILLDAKICKHCGSDQNATYSPAATNKQGNWFSNLNSLRKTIFIILLLLIVAAALNGQNLFSFVSGTVQGQVTLDVAKVEKIIIDGVKEQAGLTVKVNCPSQMIGKVGDIRKCEVIDSSDTHYFADVTIQSEKGDITWQII